MNFLDLIIKKRDGGVYNPDEIGYLVEGISDHRFPDYQVAAWAMAVYFQGMNRDETRELALAMARSGDLIDLTPIRGITVDKHSTGGVGDKTTLVVLPLTAAAGVPVAKMSGRGLGFTGGTIDKLESIPGFQVERSHAQMVEQVNRIGVALVSQSGNLVPADKRLYGIRDVTGTVESLPLIASSIMSKKLASGAEGIVLDVKVGQGAFMKDLQQAEELARAMVDIGQGAGRRVVAVLTNMDQPLGRMVGNALEVREAIDTLRGKGPADLTELCLLLTAHMLVVGEKASGVEEARDKARHLLASGQGLEKLLALVSAQGGKINLDQPSYGLPVAPWREAVYAPESGFLAAVDALQIGCLAMSLGAGRERLEDRIDHAAGVEICVQVGEAVEKGQILAYLHSSQPEKLTGAARRFLAACAFSREAVARLPVCLGVIS